MPEVIVKKDDEVQVFGKVDRNKDGNVRSEYPAYYNEEQIDELKNNINQKQIALERGYHNTDDKNVAAETIRNLKKRLDEIEESRPDLTDIQSDRMVKIRKTLGGKIADSMPKRSAMEKGTPDAHEEARREQNPCIKIDGEEISFVKACDVLISHDGKVSRNGASKAWKICSRILGENSDTEELRRP
jgi:hypothetical protein